jgi:hypothetical protein
LGDIIANGPLPEDFLDSSNLPSIEDLIPEDIVIPNLGGGGTIISQKPSDNTEEENKSTDEVEDTSAEEAHKVAIEEDTAAIEESTILTVEEQEAKLIALADEAEKSIVVKESTKLTKEGNKIASAIAKLTNDQKTQMLAGIKNAQEHGIKLTDLQKALLASTTATDTNTKLEDINTAKIDDNSLNLVASSKSIIENIDFLKREIVEIARNINVLSAHTTMVSRVNVMWAKLIGEGNRAAGKLASLKVSKSGVFSITDPGISKTDQQLFQNAANDLAASIGNQISIDIASLKEELAKIQVTLDEANTIAKEGAESVKGANNEVVEANNNITDAELNAKLATIDSFLTGGKTIVGATNEEGIQQIDINVDGTFDIDIKNGSVTEEQVEEISDRFGDKIAEAVQDALGVEAV